MKHVFVTMCGLTFQFCMTCAIEECTPMTCKHRTTLSFLFFQRQRRWSSCWSHHSRQPWTADSGMGLKMDLVWSAAASIFIPASKELGDTWGGFHWQSWLDHSSSFPQSYTSFLSIIAHMIRRLNASSKILAIDDAGAWFQITAIQESLVILFFTTLSMCWQDTIGNRGRVL